MQLLFPSSQYKDYRSGFQVRAAAVLAVLVAWLSCLHGPAVVLARHSAESSDFGRVAQAVEAHFVSLENYQRGDLISRSQIRAALASVQDAGCAVADAEAIVELGLADDAFLVREFSTPAGRKFMRQVASIPGAYARLDRLSSISRGQATVRDLIHRKGGDELVKYMATTPGGQALGRQLAATKQGDDLNKPTGRIYTSVDLLAELQRALTHASE